MRATLMYGAGDVRVETVPDARLVEPTDTLVREELLPDVLEGRIEPGRVFDRTGPLDEVPDGYRLMNEREVLKFQITV